MSSRCEVVARVSSFGGLPTNRQRLVAALGQDMADVVLRVGDMSEMHDAVNWDVWQYVGLLEFVVSSLKSLVVMKAEKVEKVEKAEPKVEAKEEPMDASEVEEVSLKCCVVLTNIRGIPRDSPGLFYIKSAITYSLMLFPRDSPGLFCRAETGKMLTKTSMMAMMRTIRKVATTLKLQLRKA